jgi:putative hemolysin
MEPTPDPSIPLSVQILFLIFLIILYAVFTASETSIINSNKNKVKNLALEGNKKATKLLDILENYDKTLSAIQLIIIFVIFLTATLAAVGISGWSSGLLQGAGVPYAKTLSVLIIAVILSFIALVAGNYYPKKEIGRAHV